MDDLLANLRKGIEKDVNSYTVNGLKNIDVSMELSTLELMISEVEKNKYKSDLFVKNCICHACKKYRLLTIVDEKMLHPQQVELGRYAITPASMVGIVIMVHALNNVDELVIFQNV